MHRARNSLSVLPGPLPASPFATAGDLRRGPGPRHLLRLAAAVGLAGLSVLVLRAGMPDASASVPANAPMVREAPDTVACDPRPWRQPTAICRQPLPDGTASRLVRIVG
ncbi:hypothetical protein [Salinarimonas chemoclinalis]|uniref:hypothetical protein n=1 Tax=Salinarimonas chemoclinalis TaxID=3241599 RepID=UPI003556A293